MEAAREGLNRAIAVAGSVKALAATLGCSRTAVANWRTDGAIPASKVPLVAQVTGLPPEVLRPDLFKAPARQPGLAEAQAPFATEAAALGIDAATIAAKAVRAAIVAERARRWATDNRAALEAHARYVEEHGLPLDSHRMF
jgi:post-segregation antitoxin (ccd killing protein)/DNA-binding transcriptional regulator YdaS (Cro superfamily)